MNRKFASALLATALMVPLAPNLRANESTKEKTESADKMRKEESKALDKYNKAVEKHGKDSTQAQKAWKHYVQEMKEHGHGSEVPAHG